MRSAKVLLVLFVLFVFVTFLSSCGRTITGSGNIISEKRNTENFVGVEAATSLTVKLKQGDQNSVTVEADDNVMRYVRTRVKGNVLVIDFDHNGSLSNVTVVVTVTAPRFTKIEASAAAVIEAAHPLTGDKISIEASSSASITAEIDAPEVNVEASSAATVRLKGKTRNLDVDASSSAAVDATNLMAENVKADASSAASIRTFASTNLDADASSGASIRYTGGGKVKQDANSGGEVTAM